MIDRKSQKVDVEYAKDFGGSAVSCAKQHNEYVHKFFLLAAIKKLSFQLERDKDNE